MIKENVNVYPVSKVIFPYQSIRLKGDFKT